MPTKKKGIHEFNEMKKKGEKITFLTCYDYPTAIVAERAGLDMLLVGDSLGMCVYGYSGTVPVTMNQCIVHAEAVRRGAPNTFLIGDMPFMSYQKTWDHAVENAGRFHKEAGCDAIKMEGGRRVITQMKGIIDAGMLVMGHIGLTPQSSGQLGGFKAQGRTLESALALVDDALAIQEAGAFALLLEAVPPEVGKLITGMLRIPVLSIGAGVHCDGQLLIVHDLLGLFEAFTPKFVKRYAELGAAMGRAFEAYIKDVKESAFPADEHTYKMVPGEWDKLTAALEKNKKG